MSDKNSVPAFPCRSIPLDPDTYLNHPGMTLRDYFAAKAMEGWLASTPENAPHPAIKGSADIIANLSYAMADSMLRARES